MFCWLALLQDGSSLLSEVQQSQLKQLQESKNLDQEVLIPVSSLLSYHCKLLDGDFFLFQQSITEYWYRVVLFNVIELWHLAVKCRFLTAYNILHLILKFAFWTYLFANSIPLQVDRKYFL